MSQSHYTFCPSGTPHTKNFKMYLKLNDQFISPFHDIPLKSSNESNIFNMVVEIPKWTNAKYEINTSELMNPIIQDIKKGELRFIRNCFPCHGYNWNYGAIPQTWEDPNQLDMHTKHPGDGDPLDVCEIGTSVGFLGEVKQIKILGCTGTLKHTKMYVFTCRLENHCN